MGKDLDGPNLFAFILATVLRSARDDILAVIDLTICKKHSVEKGAWPHRPGIEEAGKKKNLFHHAFNY